MENSFSIVWLSPCQIDRPPTEWDICAPLPPLATRIASLTCIWNWIEINRRRRYSIIVFRVDWLDIAFVSIRWQGRGEWTSKYLFIHFSFLSFHITAAWWSWRFDKRLDVSSWTSVRLRHRRTGCPSELIVLIRGKRSFAPRARASYQPFVDSFTDPRTRRHSFKEVLHSFNQSE